MKTGKSLTIVEIDVPSFNSPPDVTTMRFAADSLFLRDPQFTITEGTIPSVSDVAVESVTVSLGEDLGQRGSVTVTFDDHKHIFNGESYDSGTFWGKFRARYGLTLRGRSLRLFRGIRGSFGSELEARHYVIESTDGPNLNGKYKIIAQDPFKTAADDRAQAPVLSNGFLLSDITNSATTATLSPTGIGNAEYPASGYANIGGNEIVFFTRSGDTLTFGPSPSTRGQFNTTAVSHSANDRVQVCLNYVGQGADKIIYDLLANYTTILTHYVIDQTAWQNEVDGYLGVVYSALIAEPTGVTQLISEIIEQAALAVWPDELTQSLRLQVLRAVPSSATIYSGDNMLADSLDIQEQPDKRLTEVQIYYGKINPTVNDDQDNNYRATKRVADSNAVTQYGSSVIKKIRSRWIAAGGSTTAETVCNKLLGRYRDPPRRIKFSVMRYTDQDPLLGQGYQLQGRPFQNQDGTPATVPVQVTRVNPLADRFDVECEEMLWTPFGGDTNPATRTITFEFNENNINLRTRHDALYSAPQSGDVVNVFINAGVIIGSSSTSLPAFTTGTWPGGVGITITISGRIEGAGGNGGKAGGGVAGNGSVGGLALEVTTATTITSTSGQVWGGGGGGGSTIEAGGGGGGAGQNPGAGGAGFSSPSQDGVNGTTEAGGAGGPSNTTGSGGGPGLAGGNGASGGGTGGAAGAALSGKTFVNGGTGLTAGDIRGSQS